MQQRSPHVPVITLLLGVITGALVICNSTPFRAQNRGLKTGGKSAPAEASGPAYALVIGNDAYLYLPRLMTAESDARAVEAVLRTQYGFQTTLLLNATREQILFAVNNYRRELGATANLVIYYAGHGFNDREADKAYWLPVDARRDSNANWISSDDINTNIKVIPARHILVISDSCYAGTIARSLHADLSAPSVRQRYLQKMSGGRSRTLMASGGDEPVADGGGTRHSVFAAALLRGLALMQPDEFTAEELFHGFVQESVAGRAEQTPEYAPLRNSGHESGDYIFFRRRDGGRGGVSPTPDTPPPLPGAPSVDSAAVEAGGEPVVTGAAPRPLPDVLASYEFVVAGLGERGDVVRRTPGTARYFSEELDGRIKLELVQVPGGSFQMGTAATAKTHNVAEAPAHNVTVAGFFISKFEVTQAQWRTVARWPEVGRALNPDPSAFKGDNRPVEQVTWVDAMEFCARLSRMTGRPYRLPSEAEWEYACRAGTTTDYHFGPSIATEVANYNGESPFGSGVARKQTLPVGGVGVANPLGLYDMSGNVQEWCLDAWHDDYRAAPADAKAWGAESRELRRVARGGSWLQNGSSSRCASRVGAMARSWSNTTGFRVAVGAAPY